MSHPVHWRNDGTPVSLHFGDIYRRAGADGQGGLVQARQVFLRGCHLLPEGDTRAAWAGAARWAVLETGFGLSLNFLATWQAWRQDPQRPGHLFYSAVEAFPPTPHDLRRSAAAFPELAPLADALASQWHGLQAGVHRLCFDDERVHLTLAIGDVQAALTELSGAHDAIFLDGFSPARNPAMWSLHTFKAVARLARRGASVATWCVATEVRERLTSCGFEVERVPGLPPKRQALRAHFAPRWTARRRTTDDAPAPVSAPGRCAIIGAGLAGASAAWSLARRGWHVTVFDRAPEPAQGASGLPAGVVAPHVSPDDRPVSRLTRAGARATLARATLLLREGIDYAATGVLERHAPGERRLPAPAPEATLSDATRAESLDAGHPLTRDKAQLAGVTLDADRQALWHTRAGWIRPATLVRAMLQAPGIDWRGSTAVARIERGDTGWRLHDAHPTVLAEVDLVVIAAGFDSLSLLGGPLPLHALRGQVAFGPMPGGSADAALPPFPVNGHGSLIAHLPGDPGPWWITGSSFERANPRADLSMADHAANRERLAPLLPQAAAALDAQWPDGRAQAWAAVRATLPDRLPAVGAWTVTLCDGLASKQAASPIDKAPEAIKSGVNFVPLAPHLCTGLGARGLTLAVLCGELLAAMLHGEPLPVARSLAARLRASRFTSPNGEPPAPSPHGAPAR